MRCVRIKYDKIVLTYKHRHICEVVHCIEAKSEPTNLLGVMHFGCFIKFCYVNKVLIFERCIVVHPEGSTLTFFHSIVNETGHGIFVGSFIVQEFNLSGTSIICVLYQLF